MHIRYIVKNDSGSILSCVIDGEKDLTGQFEEILHIRRGNGIGVLLRETQIEVTDYYHGSAVALFDILSREKTDAPVSLRWTALEESK